MPTLRPVEGLIRASIEHTAIWRRYCCELLDSQLVGDCQSRGGGRKKRRRERRKRRRRRERRKRRRRRMAEGREAEEDG